MSDKSCDVLVVGSGIVGIASAYYLKKIRPDCSVILLDSNQAMALTSAQSGENYRTWWPHPVMCNFIDRSIDLMEEIATLSNNRINLTRRGYALATRRSHPDDLLSELQFGYSQSAPDSIRIHTGSSTKSYVPADNCKWDNSPTGVDVISDRQLIQRVFPTYDTSVSTLLHVRRAGSVDSQQLGQFMLESFKASGGIKLQGKVVGIEKKDGFTTYLENTNTTIRCDKLVNAAGPFINMIAGLLGTSLPVTNTLQQKIAFEDIHGAIPRAIPFSIDLDAQFIDWSDEERQLLLEDSQYSFYSEEMPGSIHCRPDGGDKGSWVKLGWAYNNTSEAPVRNPILSNEFPEIVLRGAARLNPALKCYYGKLPANLRHYGGYYTLTDENWPLVGEMNVANAYVVGAMSGFGTMAACGAGELCAQHVLEQPKAEYSSALSLQRYQNKPLMKELTALSSRGIL